MNYDSFRAAVMLDLGLTYECSAMSNFRNMSAQVGYQRYTYSHPAGWGYTYDHGEWLYCSPRGSQGQGATLGEALLDEHERYSPG